MDAQITVWSTVTLALAGGAGVASRVVGWAKIPLTKRFPLKQLMG
jgi:hypothetical protein